MFCADADAIFRSKHCKILPISFLKTKLQKKYCYGFRYEHIYNNNGNDKDNENDNDNDFILFNIIIDYRKYMVCNTIYGTTINW